jgi:hypothetical protein
VIADVLKVKPPEKVKSPVKNKRVNRSGR